MELKIKQVTFPEVIEFNFEELKKEITERAELYKTLVYTDDQIKQAKTDRASLNKFVKALSDERIKVKKQCLQPYEEFEAKIAELTRIVNEPIQLIDNQVKHYEEYQKQKKHDEIKVLFFSLEHPDWLTFEQIDDPRWQNASASMKSIEESMKFILDSVAKATETIANLPEFAFEAMEVYKTTLDLTKAINEGHRLSEIQKRKAAYEEEQAKKKAEEQTVTAEPIAPVTHEAQAISSNLEHVEKKPTRQLVRFAAMMTVDEARELKKFFDDRAIEYKPI